jgi:hypothetical protein
MYENGKIYKIVDLTNDDIYIGSTCKSLEKRLKGHLINYRRYKKGEYRYMTAFDIIDNDDYEIELIENFPCDNKKELFSREGYTIRNNVCVNIIIPGRNHKQYYLDNKEERKEKVKLYYQNNKIKILEKAKMKNVCDCGGKYTCRSRSVHRKTKKHINYINNLL